MPIFSELKSENVPIKLWTPHEGVEYSALTQLKNTASLPWAFHHVAVMPDVHYGKGATVGSVIATKNAISPAAVGVDLSCGMAAIKTNLKASDLPEDLKKVRSAIERNIPVGFNSHSKNGRNLSHFRHGREMVAMRELWAQFGTLHEKVQDKEETAKRQMGSLGGGNHFYELCLDTEQGVWVMLHSGSRNIGKTLAEIHIYAARKLAHNNALPDPDLAVFLAGTEEMKAYLRDLTWAQEYARLNRLTMIEISKGILNRLFPQIKYEEPIHCHHNYVSQETHFGEDVIITRKGAISARTGELGLIPGSMGTKSYVVRGLGNPESFHSASHGAGRRMSRGAARRTFTNADLLEQTKGVECRKDDDVIDEIPAAYKSIDEVIKNQSDLVEIVAELKQVLCVKG